MRSRLRRVVLTVALLVAALMPGRADAHGTVGYRYSSVPRWAHYQPARHCPVHHFADRIVCKPVNKTVNPTPVRVAGYRQVWLVTYYLATGSPMANGIYPSVGWAACGYDVALGTRVAVSGYGVFTCGDRIGFDPFQHIDIFGIPLGTHYQTVTVYR